MGLKSNPRSFAAHKMALTTPPDAVRAQMHAQLAALERAGVPVSQALAMLRLPGLQSRIGKTVSLLGQGHNLADAGHQAGIFTPFESTVLGAAIQAGSPAIAHERLATAAAARARRNAQVRARLAMPVFVLAIALFLQPLPALIAGTISGADYLLSTVGVLLLLAGCIAALSHFARLHSQGLEGPGRSQVEALALRVPLLGDLVQREQAQVFFENLALLLNCGLAMFDALPAATRTLSWQTARLQFGGLLPRMQAGASLSDALRSLTWPGLDTVIGMAATGEGSGRLPDLLARYAAAEGSLLSDRREQLATWIPRIAYALIVVWMAQGVLGGMTEVIVNRQIE